jgi:mRNA interferase MazF
MTTPRRGELWEVARGSPSTEHEPAGVCAVLILSEDRFNATGRAAVLPITSKPRAVRTRVELWPPEAGLKQVSYVVCERIRTLSLRRFRKPMGRVGSATMARVDNVVRIVLGL